MTEETLPTTTTIDQTTTVPQADDSMKWAIVWFIAQLIKAAGGYITFDQEVMYWREYYNPNNYSTGWSIFDAAPFKWWGYEVVWTLAWSGIALLNIIFKIAGLDSLFNGIAVASILGPLGSLGILGYANYTGDSFTKRTSSSDPGKWLATISTLVASQVALTTDIYTVLKLMVGSSSSTPNQQQEQGIEIGTDDNGGDSQSSGGNSQSTGGNSSSSDGGSKSPFCTDYQDQNGNWCDSSTTDGWGFRLI